MKTAKPIGITLIVLGLCMAGWAQEKDSDPRVSKAYGPYVSISPGEPSETPAIEGDEIKPDTTPLTGVERFTLGSEGGSRSFLAPTFRFSQTVDTNGAFVGGHSELEAVSYVSGNLELHRVWSKAQLTAHYAGGGSFYQNNTDLNSMFHNFGLAQTFRFRRWSLHLSDEASYLPESSFGYAGLGNFASDYLLNSVLIPNQSILTNHSSRISNTVVGQVDYVLGPKSSITASGTYGILRFPDGGLIDSNQEGFQVGYNYALNTHDSLGLSYGLNLFRFSGSGRDMNNHSVQVAYGRRITGRMALQVSGGPQISTYRDAVRGSGSWTSWSVNSAMSYRLRRANLQVSYSHYTSGGSGVLAGASTNQIQGSVSRQLTRTLSGSLTAGYAHNSDLQQFRIGPEGNAFNSQFVGLSLSRPVGHQASVYFSYNLQHQSTNSAVCSGGTCGTDVLRHVFGFGLEWHMRPLLISQ